MNTAGRKHWNDVYDRRDEAALTWFEASPDLSFDLVVRHLTPGASVLDVGGGASRLVDRLIAEGVGPVTVLDLSDAALAATKARLGEAGDVVSFVTADVTDWIPDRRFAVWHDRAAFHFLTDREDRAGYLRTLDRALTPGGAAIIATFADDGPETCSGLPVMRYAPEELADELERLAPGLLVPVEARRHTHVTPKGNRQQFQYSMFRRGG